MRILFRFPAARQEDRAHGSLHWMSGPHGIPSRQRYITSFPARTTFSPLTDLTNTDPANYTDHNSRPPINGAILQAGVSDREAWDFLLESPPERASRATVLATAQRLIAAGKEKEIVPREDNIVQKELGAPISAYRTNSLLAKGGDDDYFSTDLDDATLRASFGRVPKHVPLMFLLGSEDPFVHPSTDKEALLKRWAGFVKEGGGKVDEVHGGIVKGAHHNLDGDPEEVVTDLVDRVVGYLGGLEEDTDGGEARL